MQPEPSLESSITHALRGLSEAARTEHNFRTHILAAALVILCGIFFRVSVTEWLFLSTAIAGVMILELVNAVIERVVDIAKPRLSPIIKDIKDMMAAAVLVAAMAAAFIGAVIFLPRILALVGV